MFWNIMHPKIKTDKNSETTPQFVCTPLKNSHWED